MEREMFSQRGKKRQLVENSDNGSISEVYRFKILLPNGMAVGLNVRDPGPKMPLSNFIGLVKDEYSRVREHSESVQRKWPINWSIGTLSLQDANDVKMTSTVNFKNFKPHKCHILLLHDGSGKFAETFENMWDLTPDTDMLKETPESYTFETALADLIDNSLQAVWSNSKTDQRLISVDVLKDRISILDTGPGMDGGDENSIVKWGKIGASLHRSKKEQAVGGKPPYLMPYFGMFGSGGAFASMHLGKHALVSSKTKHSKKVYTLRLEREALLGNSSSELSWKTEGGIRDPLETELAKAPCGSFTKVEIFEPNIESLDLFQLQCRLKDIYFPYIQCDEVSNSGKTITPVEFQVNGTDLAEIEGGEVAITNLHSCNGPDFILQLHFSFKQDSVTKSPGSRSYREANARLKCVYFPVVEGRENIENILEKLEAGGHQISENFESFSRVSIRRLGRLIPDARWLWLPFMDLRHKRGSKAQLLKKCCLRVKCFIDTDAGINPTPSKTDLAHHSPFTTALKNFGLNLRENEKGINIRAYRDGKLLTPSQLERDYQDWIMQMHSKYDEEVDHGEDEPVLVVSPNPAKGKTIGISSDVLRLHQILKRKGENWKSGQKIKILKGSCAGVYKNNVYATIEYFALGGFQGDAGGENQIICRPLGTPDEDGCVLSEVDGMTCLEIRGSMTVPISVIDSEKCIPVGSAEWNNQVQKLLQKSPSTIDLLSTKECEELEVEELPATATAGKVPPKDVVAVVRPANYVSKHDSRVLDQKYIFKCNIEMFLEIKLIGKKKDIQDAEHVYSGRMRPSSHQGIQGIYVFPLGRRFPHLFQKAGVYTFSFSLIDSSCKTFIKRVAVNASSEIGKWELLSDKQSQPYSVRVGSTLRPLSIACYDIYENRTCFTSNPEVVVKLQAIKDVDFHIKKFRSVLSSSKSTLKVEDLLIESSDLDKIRPVYEATLVISSPDGIFTVSIPCRVTPGCLQLVKSQQSVAANQLLPGFIVKELELEMFDAYGNHVVKGLEVQLDLEGFQILDHVGLMRKVDNHGCVDLSGLLKVTASYGENVSLSVSSVNKIFLKQEFQIERRELRIASKVPDFLTAGSILENIIFEVVNSNGVVDDAIHDEEKIGQSHLLTIKADSLNTDDSIRYTFKHGRCTVPAIPIPQREGIFHFLACHSRHSNLSLSVEVHVVRPSMQSPKVEYNEIQSPDKGIFLLQDSSSFKQAGKSFIMSIESNKEGLEEEILKYGLFIGNLEAKLEALNVKKQKVEENLEALQDSTEPYLPSFPNCFSTREELMEEIEKMGNSAAAVLCNISREVSFQEPKNHLMRDVIGLVALLGRVHSSQLSRILSEHLGADQMLAVVSRSFKAASVLGHALRTEAATLGKSLSGRFLVICLEDISPYRDAFEGGGSQRKLALPLPHLRDGTIPEGFLGFAVNMIDLDINQLSIRTNSGDGLRETLFYRLFGQLHVYRTNEEMLAARACIKHGAVSLDGGILKENGIISLGFGDPGICFQVITTKSEMPFSQETLMQLEEKRSELRKINEDIEEKKRMHKKVMKKFRTIQKDHNKLMNNVQPILEHYYLEYGSSAEGETIRTSGHDVQLGGRS